MNVQETRILEKLYTEMNQRFQSLEQKIDTVDQHYELLQRIAQWPEGRQ